MSVKAKGDSHRFNYNGVSMEARLTPSAFIELEDLGFGDINTLVSSLQAKPSFKTVVHVLAAALRGSVPDISFDTALSMANEMGAEETVSVVSKIVEAAFPKAKAAGEAGKAKAGKPAGA